MNGPGETFYRNQVAMLHSREIDRLVADHYHDDALLVAFDFIVQGHTALRRHFASYMERLGELVVLSTDNFTETADTLFFEATVQTGLGRFRVYDAMVMSDGKISYHFTGVK